MMPTEDELEAMAILVHPRLMGGYVSLQKIERERIVDLCLRMRTNVILGGLYDYAGVIVDQLRDMSHNRG